MNRFFLLPVASAALLLGAFGYRAFRRHRRRTRYSVNSVSEAWLIEQRRER